MWTSKLMIDGVWRGDVERTPAIDARMAAHAGAFAGRVTRDGRSPHPAAAGRHHLYLSHACPFAHRTALVHRLKRLDGVVGISVVHPRWNTPDGWVLADGPLSTADGGGCGFTHLHQAFSATRPDYTGRVTVPVLWDRVARRIVSDDSLAIMRMLNDAFDEVGGDRSVDLWGGADRDAVEATCRAVADDVGVGAYRIGGAESARDRAAAQDAFFAALARLDARLSDGRPYLHGDALRASDLVLFTPLVRLEAVYAPLFGADRHRLAEFPRLARWLARLTDDPEITGTLHPDHVRIHYFDGWAPKRFGDGRPVARHQGVRGGPDSRFG